MGPRAEPSRPAAGYIGHTEGKRISLDITRLDSNDAAAVARVLVTRDVKQLSGLQLNVTGWIADFEYDEHSPLEVNLIFAGEGKSTNTRSSIISVDYDKREVIGGQQMASSGGGSGRSATVRQYGSWRSAAAGRWHAAMLPLPNLTLGITSYRLVIVLPGFKPATAAWWPTNAHWLWQSP